MEKEELLAHEDGRSLDYEAALDNDTDHIISSDGRRLRTSSNKRHWKNYSIPFVTFLLGVAVTILGIKAMSTGIQYRHWTTSYTPAASHISFKPERDQKAATPEKDSMYFYHDPPSDAQEEAWEELLTPIVMPLSPEEMQSAGEDPQNTLQMADRKNYMGILGVYHELHCLRRIRKLVYKDHWYANKTAEWITREIGHADHCFHLLHKSAMCYANTGIATYKYSPIGLEPSSASNAQRMCVDWDKFHTWAIGASVASNSQRYRPSGV